jgi:hypothetical protein
MAKGKQIGEYSGKLTSIRVIPEGKSSVIEMNLEGTASGFGVVIATMTCVAGKSGAYKYQGLAYLDNGDIISGVGQGGKFESIGKHLWRTEGTIQPSDGSPSVVEEGQVDLATRSWTVKLFESVK